MSESIRDGGRIGVETTDVSATTKTFQRWLDRGDLVGVFENHDLGHVDVGRLVFVPLTPSESVDALAGRMHAPDTAGIGMGWRYVCVAAEPSLGRFDFTVYEPEPEPEPKRKRTRS